MAIAVMAFSHILALQARAIAELPQGGAAYGASKMINI